MIAYVQCCACDFQRKIEAPSIAINGLCPKCGSNKTNSSVGGGKPAWFRDAAQVAAQPSPTETPTQEAKP